MLPEGYKKEDIIDSEAKMFINGYESAIDDIIYDILYNLQDIGDAGLVLDPDIALVNQNKAQIIADAVKICAYSNRDNHIISILDNQEDE